jgi:Winged helix DNA-binding domain
VERVLTQPELNRALLARQLLLERGRTPIPRALERIGGIQAQYAPSMYVGLWSRLDGLERAALTRALERRTVVQATLLRATIHLVSKADYWPFAVAIREPRRMWWLRVKGIADPRPLEAAARKLRQALAERPLRWKEIQELLGEHARGVGFFVDLVRVPPSGTWERRRADLYAAAEDWVGPEDVGEPEARDLVVRRYLSGFGPARATEIADWAGLDTKDLVPSLDRLELRRFRDEEGKELLDLPRALRPDAETPAPPRFLPTWDATLLVHARRTQILPEEYRPRIFSTKTPNSFNTFLVDGAVAGTWRFEDDRIVLDPFHRLDARRRRELEEEAERLAAFHGP